MDGDIRERHVAHELEAGHDHPADPEIDDFPCGAVHVIGVEGAKILGLVRPAECRKGPQGGRKPGVEDIRVLRELTVAALAAFDRALDRNRAMAVLTVINGDSVAQPQLAADVPVAKAMEPVEICALIALRVPADFTVLARGQGLVAHLVHPQPPLLADERLDDRIAAIAVAHIVRIWLLLDKESLRFEVADHELARLQQRQAVIRQAGNIHAPIEMHAVDDVEVMPLADVVVHGVVTRRDLQGSRAEVLLHRLVGDDRKLSAHQRQDRGLADDRAVAYVCRVDRDAGVGQHRLRPHGRDRHLTAALDRVANEVQRVVVLLPLHLQVRDGRLVVRAPVDDPGGAIDPAAVVESDECSHHRTHIALVHREAKPRPVQ